MIGAKLVVHSVAEPVLLVPALQREIAQLDADMPLSNIRTMKQVFITTTAHRKFITLLIELFMAITLVLAVAGVYGVICYQTSQRTREFGLRLAFGASRGQIHRLVLRSAWWIANRGALLGLFATLNMAFIVRHLIYGVSALDVFTVALGAILVITVALFASYQPARRAAQLDPMTALRYE